MDRSEVGIQESKAEGDLGTTITFHATMTYKVWRAKEQKWVEEGECYNVRLGDQNGNDTVS